MSQRPNMLVLAGGALFLLPMVVLFAVSFGNDPKALPSVLTNQPAPLFNLEDTEGEPVSLEGLRGTPVVINFWSTWCGPCKQEHGLLLEGAKRYPDVQFLGVIYADSVNKVRRYLQEKGSGYPHLLDPTGRTAIEYGVGGVPETYFVDTSGTVVYKQVGPLNVPILQFWLDQLRGTP